MCLWKHNIFPSASCTSAVCRRVKTSEKFRFSFQNCRFCTWLFCSSVRRYFRHCCGLFLVSFRMITNNDGNECVSFLLFLLWLCGWWDGHRTYINHKKAVCAHQSLQEISPFVCFEYKKMFPSVKNDKWFGSTKEKKKLFEQKYKRSQERRRDLRNLMRKTCTKNINYSK